MLSSIIKKKTILMIPMTSVGSCRHTSYTSDYLMHKATVNGGENENGDEVSRIGALERIKWMCPSNEFSVLKFIYILIL